MINYQFNKNLAWWSIQMDYLYEWESKKYLCYQDSDWKIIVGVLIGTKISWRNQVIYSTFGNIVSC